MYGEHSARRVLSVAMNILKIAALAPFLLLTAAQSAGEVEVSIEGLRNGRGDVHLCLTRDPRHFPNCRNDPAAIKRTVPASTTRVSLSVAPGEYALSVFHDENRNRELDTMLRIPREGFGFSRNPRIRFGAPRFRDVRVGIVSGFTRLSVRMQYML
jgi:uncharacterized protein (DUF2141 family)